MLKKKVDGLEDYYYQWMNKYKDDADRRLELLREAKKVIYYISARQMVDDDTVNEFLERVEKDVHGAWKHTDDCELAEAIDGV